MCFYTWMRLKSVSTQAHCSKYHLSRVCKWILTRMKHLHLKQFFFSLWYLGLLWRFLRGCLLLQHCFAVTLQKCFCRLRNINPLSLGVGFTRKWLKFGFWENFPSSFTVIQSFKLKNARSRITHHPAECKHVQKYVKSTSSLELKRNPLKSQN